jgi:L-aminopeptidase/D-esterase-like protein
MAPLRDSITDVAGIRVGHWTDRRSITGCSVVLCPPGTTGGVDVRGAAPGTRETDLLRPENLVEEVHAVVLAGGSAFGLDAASGVMRHLREQGVGVRFGDFCIPIVPAAILFDLGIGTQRAPDAEAGARAARRATGGRVAEGSVGAGTGATVAKLAGRDRHLKSGIGTASEAIGGGIVVGALVATNAIGSIRDPRTGEVVAAPRAEGGGFADVDALLRLGRLSDEERAAYRLELGGDDPPPGDAPAPENTTIGVVATNAKLTKTQASRLASIAHDGLARAIWPVHMRGDGDAMFALATGEVEVDDRAYRSLEAMAALATERAVLRGVRLAQGLGGVPSAAEWRAS